MHGCYGDTTIPTRKQPKILIDTESRTLYKKGPCLDWLLAPENSISCTKIFVPRLCSLVVKYVLCPTVEQAGHWGRPSGLSY